MNTARAYNFGTAGVKTAALNFGGNEPPGAVTAKTENWDGATWTEVADLNDCKRRNWWMWNTNSSIGCWWKLT